jgi:hypothetical protein
MFSQDQLAKRVGVSYNQFLNVCETFWRVELMLGWVTFALPIS